jgi:hypothetical protein
MPRERSESARARGAIGAADAKSAFAVSAEQRERMICEAAYYRALQRGFRGGDPVEDWLTAEREIDRALPSPSRQQEELAAYEKLREQAEKLLARLRDTVDAEAIGGAIDAASEALAATGRFTAETVAKVRSSLQKDLVSASHRMGPRWEAFSEQGADLFAVWRDRGQLFLSKAASAVGDWLTQTGAKLEHPTYRTGEMAAGGVLECTECGERLELARPAHVPPCPRCQKMEFRRRT